MRISEQEPGWGRPHPLWRPELAVVWLTLGLMLFGAVLLQSRIGPAFVREVSAASLAVVIWVLYAVPFVLIVRQLDLLEPEPPAFLACAFAWGALVAAPVALVANTSGRAIITNLHGASAAEDWTGVWVAPATEEVMKVLGVVVMVLVARQQITTVLDGLVYGAFVGLGFQVVENLLYTTDQLRGLLFGREPGQAVLDVFALRGLELGLWSHVVYSGLAGFGVAYAVAHRRGGPAGRALVAVGCLVLAWALHAIWNAPFTDVPDGAGQAQRLAVYAAKGVPALLLVLALVWLAGRREVVWLDAVLHDEDEVTVSASDRLALVTRRARRAAVAGARRQGGGPAARAARNLQAAQVHLALCKTRTDDAQVLGSARARVAAARAELEATAAGRDASAAPRAPG